MRSRNADGIQMVSGNRGKSPKEIGAMEVERDPGAMARIAGVEARDPGVGQGVEKESIPKEEKVEKAKARMEKGKAKASGAVLPVVARSC